MDIDRLIEAARAGDRDALEQLLRRHQPRLLQLARRRLRGAPWAAQRPSDLMQDTALRVVGRFHLFRGTTDSELRTWLSTILVNGLIQHQRAGSRRKRAGATVPLQGDDRLQAAGPSPSQQVIGRQGWRRLLAAVFDLPEAQREAVYRSLRGAGIKEIAADLGRTRAAVSCLLQRGMTTLREQFGGDRDTLQAILAEGD